MYLIKYIIFERQSLYLASTELFQIFQPDFIVKFEPTRRGKPVRDSRAEGTTQSVKQVSAKQVAYNMPCPFILPVGARILAKFRDELKTEPIGDGQFYAGIVAEPPKNTNKFR
jgi:hypothetical protein